ncbi:MAG: EAL domain-containing protein [Actinomycetota bacterium]|nr:EAL domain-containing protein [Actinomycetota bacterium]
MTAPIRLTTPAGSAGPPPLPLEVLDRSIDPVTRLPNRVEALAQLGHLLARVDSGLGPIAVLLVDLDGFRRVNRDRGHAVGDELLFSAGRRIVAAVEPTDVVGRAGSDEFVVISPGLGPGTDTAALVRRILATFDDPFDLGADPLTVTASVGVVLAEDGSTRPEALISEAEGALDRNRAGTRRFELFDPGLRTRIESRSALASELAGALRTNRLTLAYQPVIDIASGRIAGMEALARWRHDERGPISPELFVSVAEESGLADALLERVLEHAAADFPSIAAADTGGRIWLAFNVSAIQLLSDLLPSGIGRLIARTGIAPERVVVEITERALRGDAEEYRDRILELRQLGVRISLDDFGTASTSIAQMRALPIDQIKLDRSFVRGLGDGSADAALAAGLLPMARALDIAVVAEGIETDQQLAHLFALGYRWGQGYRFAVPEPPARAVALVAEGPLPAANAPRTARWRPEHERFCQALRAGDAIEAEAVVAGALASGIGAMAIQTEIIGRALHWIDSEWEAGRLDAADQHLAAAICERQLTTVLAALRPAHRRRFSRRVLLAAIRGDDRGAELKSAADTLGDAGYETVFLGTDVRRQALAEATGTHRPGAVCLTLTEPDADAALDAVLDGLSAVADPPLVLVSGDGLVRETAHAGAIAVSSASDALDVLARELEPEPDDQPAG